MEDPVVEFKPPPVRCSGCDKKASSLKCPTCVKIGMPDSYWCDQECFKKSWGFHKQFHRFYAPDAAGVYTDQRFATYKYSGKLRKGFEGPRRLVPESIPRPCYVNHPRGEDPRETDAKRERVITQHSPDEIKTMREVSTYAREVLNEAHKACKIGATTDEIDRVVHEACIERNCYPSPLGYGFFPKSCCTSVNEVVCHGIPDSYELKDGDIVNVDVSVYCKGMHSDLNETYLIGNVDEKGQKLVKATYECLWNAIKMCKPGVQYREMGSIIEKTAKKRGVSVIRTYCGHGVGELFHCSPTVPHYAKNKAVGTMKPGHIFTIEPMINEGTWEEERWPDNWTSATQDGKRSAQFEETLLITDTGVQVLTLGDYIPPGVDKEMYAKYRVKE